MGNEDTSLEPITSLHVALVQVLVDQFFFYMSSVLPMLLQDIEASEAIMMALDGQVNSIRKFDAALAD